MENAKIESVSTSYVEPVRQLLTLGRSSGYDPAEWPDYAAVYGLTPEHVDPLISLASDVALNQGDPDSAEVLAPVHAWRALGQFRAEAAIAPLLTLLTTIEGDEAADEELPIVLGMIGPAALKPLAAFLADQSQPRSAAISATAAVKEIAERHPACRAESIDILTRVLEPESGTHPTTSGCAVSALLDLRAVESIDAMRAAFDRKAIDLSIAGDLEDLEIELGLRKSRTTPRPHYVTLPGFGPSAWETAARVQPTSPSVLSREKVGRNDPCPCGSGKKYKKCCLP
jgi:hypothetical protein